MKRSHFRSTTGRNQRGEVDFCCHWLWSSFYPWSKCWLQLITTGHAYEMLSGLTWLLAVLRTAGQPTCSALWASCFWKVPCTCWRCWHFMPVCISPFDPSLLCILSCYRYFPYLSILRHRPSSTATIFLIKLWRKDKSLFSKCHRGKRS